MVKPQKLPKGAVECLSLKRLETETNSSLLLLFLQWLGGWSRSLWSALPTRVSLWSHSVALLNINSLWLKKQNNKITCFKNERNIIWKQLLYFQEGKISLVIKGFKWKRKICVCSLSMTSSISNVYCCCSTTLIHIHIISYCVLWITESSFCSSVPRDDRKFAETQQSKGIVLLYHKINCVHCNWRLCLEVNSW